MFQRFFVPLDGSLRAEKAIPIAAALARASAGTVILVSVVVPPLNEEYGANIVSNEALLIQGRERTEARAYLDEVIERYEQVLEGLHLIVEVTSDTGTVASSLLSLAEQEHTDLIVMCSRGGNWFKRWIFGSVAQNTIRHSPLPVLALNEHGLASVLENPTRPLRLLVPLDGSSFAEAVLRPLCQWLALFPSTEPHELHLRQVVTILPAGGRLRSGANGPELLQQDEMHRAEQYLQTVTQLISGWIPEKIKVVVTTEVIAAPEVAGTLIKQAQAKDVDLIVLATHGRSGIKRVFLGSVTEHIFGATTLPLFVVCPPAVEAEKESIGQGAQEAVRGSAG